MVDTTIAVFSEAPGIIRYTDLRVMGNTSACTMSMDDWVCEHFDLT
jgi:hypothetical protein